VDEWLVSTSDAERDALGDNPYSSEVRSLIRKGEDIERAVERIGMTEGGTDPEDLSGNWFVRVLLAGLLGGFLYGNVVAVAIVGLLGDPMTLLPTGLVLGSMVGAMLGLIYGLFVGVAQAIIASQVRPDRSRGDRIAHGSAGLLPLVLTPWTWHDPWIWMTFSLFPSVLSVVICDLIGRRIFRVYHCGQARA
jgi:hypothetical protein